METCGDADRVTRAKRSQLAVWTCSQDAPVRSRLLVEMALGGLEAHHRNNSGRVHSTAEARVPSATCLWSKGQLDSKDAASLLSCFTFLSACSKDFGANAAFSNVRRVTEPSPSQNGNRNPWRLSHCWQVTMETPLPRRPLGRKRRSARFQAGANSSRRDCETGTA